MNYDVCLRTAIFGIFDDDNALNPIHYNDNITERIYVRENENRAQMPKRPDGAPGV